MIKHMLTEAFQVNQIELTTREEKKKGWLRGGSCGCTVDGQYYGECPRLAQRRLNGMNKEIEESSDLVFNIGFAHENRTLNYLLKHDEVKNITIPESMFEFSMDHSKLTVGCKVEMEIEGVMWSGSPDFMVELHDGRKFGIETKAVASNSSAAKIKDWDFPYTKAILQAAMYSYATSLPWHILYGNYFYAGSYKKKVGPFLKEFEVNICGDKVFITREDGDTVDTGFTLSGILQFYKDVATSKEALPRPFEKEMGNTYNRCDYCSVNEECQRYDLGIITSEELVGGEND